MAALKTVGRFLGGYRASAAFIGYVALCAVVIAVGLRGEDTRGIASRDCTSNPRSQTCIEAKDESDRARSVKSTCIQFKKVGYPCPRPRSRVARAENRQQQHSGSSTPQSQPQPPPSTEPQPQAPDTGAVGKHGNAPKHPGSSKNPVPESTATEPSPSAPPSVSEAPPVEVPQHAPPAEVEPGGQAAPPVELPSLPVLEAGVCVEALGRVKVGCD